MIAPTATSRRQRDYEGCAERRSGGAAISARWSSGPAPNTTETPIVVAVQFLGMAGPRAPGHREAYGGKHVRRHPPLERCLRLLHSPRHASLGGGAGLRLGLCCAIHPAPCKNQHSRHLSLGRRSVCSAHLGCCAVSVRTCAHVQTLPSDDRLFCVCLCMCVCVRAGGGIA